MLITAWEMVVLRTGHCLTSSICSWSPAVGLVSGALSCKKPALFPFPPSHYPAVACLQLHSKHLPPPHSASWVCLSILGREASMWITDPRKVLGSGHTAPRSRNGTQGFSLTICYIRIGPLYENHHRA